MKYQIKILMPALALIFCFFMIGTKQGTPDFKVFYVQGKVKKINQPNTFMLKKGSKLMDNDMITIASGAQVILICKKFNNIKLDKPDTVRLRNIESKCSERRPSTLSAYFHFIWDELTGEQPDEQDYLHNIGAVKRNRGRADEKQTTLFLDTINYLNGDLKIKFADTGNSRILKCYDTKLHDHLVTRISIKANDFDFDSLATRIKATGVFYWTVTGLQLQPKPGFYLKIWRDKEYHQAVDSLLNTVIKTGPAETAYMAGFVLENNCFLTGAFKYYALAHKLDPQNKIYKTAYSRFL